ncbi:ComEC/Rec2 family competence protein [Nocardioides daeguensis]|uniref:ComEC/Rec2 family competence protein n=1 Tax=Nocardioides daeguensis TaxID=908359 RepID=UPI001C44D735|nr:ComEC/Rec2 family competence protein [Nocardioides daeguensis]MBV6727420.1 ComEC/Rec2 family competence protein [Nocardioides daeguensis]MCR1775510.1 ComEC/Rec2 family competence protein [Nocardioides daeguensis]
MPVLGAAAWVGGITARQGGNVAYAGLLGLAGLLWATAPRLPPGLVRLLLAALLVAAAAVTGTVLRHDAVRGSPLHDLAAERATADLVGTVVSDPRVIVGRAGPQVVVRLRVQEVTSRGRRLRTGGSVVVIGSPAWSASGLGERVVAEGRLAESDEPGTAALLTGARDPVRVRGADPWWRASAAVRASIRHAVAHRPPDQAGLVPALVDGDDASLPDDLERDFRTTGLTHLTAVSGTNLTLVVGSLLLVARAAGVRRRWLAVVGLAGIVGFVLLARTEPSVLRAAVMGVVGLFAFGPDGRRRGLRALGVAVAALVLVQPDLAVAAGFALSVLATAGIVLLGPPLATALARWLPRPVAEAIAVPTAAQLACTPVIAGLSGEVSLVAIGANLLAGPAVGPATVLGLAGGLVGLVWPWAGRLCGTLAGWSVGWIIAVAEHAAALPGAAVGWGSGAFALGGLVVLCLLAGLVLPRLVRHRAAGAVLAVLLLLVVLGVPGRLWSAASGGWPPPGWVLVACDVGQGDALALAVGSGAAIVIDAGPDPRAVDGCLDRLGVEQVPLVVITHFHADHVDGLEGVLDGRSVGGIETTPLADPPGGVDRVRRAAQAAGVPVAPVSYGGTRRVGAATLQVLHPDLARAGDGPVEGPGDGSTANDASVVLLVVVAGVRLLLTGDVEPPGQAQVARLVGDLDVDVLKVPHHGSRHQDLDWLTSLRPEVALVSVGADNDYGHPSAAVLRGLQGAGARVLRTDRDGDVAVVADGSGVVRTVSRE